MPGLLPGRSCSKSVSRWPERHVINVRSNQRGCLEMGRTPRVKYEKLGAYQSKATSKLEIGWERKLRGLRHLTDVRIKVQNERLKSKHIHLQCSIRLSFHLTFLESSWFSHIAMRADHLAHLAIRKREGTTRNRCPSTCKTDREPPKTDTDILTLLMQASPRSFQQAHPGLNVGILFGVS